MFYLIIIIVALLLWAYIDFNAAKATGRWAYVGVKGVANDISALKAEVAIKQVADPDRQDNIVKSINDNFIDTASYHEAATKRSLKAHTALKAKIADSPVDFS